MLILRTVLSLALVIALIAALAWLARRYLRPDRWMLSRSPGSLKIVERFAIDAKKSLLVVDWHHKRLLVGATESSLCLLDTLHAMPKPLSEPSTESLRDNVATVETGASL